MHAFRITVKKTDDPEESASIRRRIKWVEQKTTNEVLEQLNWRPSFHLIVTGHPAGVSPAAGSDSSWGLTLRSILEQSWPLWRVTVIASGELDIDEARSAIRRLAHDQTERFAMITPSDTGTWQEPFTSATGAFQSGDRRNRDRRRTDRRSDVWFGSSGDGDPRSAALLQAPARMNGLTGHSGTAGSMTPRGEVPRGEVSLNRCTRN